MSSENAGRGGADRRRETPVMSHATGVNRSGESGDVTRLRVGRRSGLGPELALEDRDEEVARAAGRLQEAGIHAIGLSAHQVQHRPDEGWRGEHFHVIRYPLFRHGPRHRPHPMRASGQIGAAKWMPIRARSKGVAVAAANSGFAAKRVTTYGASIGRPIGFVIRSLSGRPRRGHRRVNSPPTTRSPHPRPAASRSPSRCIWTAHTRPLHSPTSLLTTQRQVHAVAR